MAKWLCQICGYIHDSEKEGVSFEDLPDTYVCPICLAEKDQFEEI